MRAGEPGRRRVEASRRSFERRWGELVEPLERRSGLVLAGVGWVLPLVAAAIGFRAGRRMAGGRGADVSPAPGA